MNVTIISDGMNNFSDNSAASVLCFISAKQNNRLRALSNLSDRTHLNARHIIITASKLVHTNLQAGLEDCTTGLYFGISLLPTHLIELVC